VPRGKAEDLVVPVGGEIGRGRPEREASVNGLPGGRKGGLRKKVQKRGESVPVLIDHKWGKRMPSAQRRGASSFAGRSGGGGKGRAGLWRIGI